MRIPDRRSPCRIDQSKGARQHRCSSSHAELVEGYRLWRETEEAAAEAATMQYSAELADYWQQRTRPTFRAYLLGTGRSGV